MKIFIHAILITAVILMAVLALTSEVKTPFVTENKADVRAFIRNCDGLTIVRERGGVFELECRND